MEVIALLGGSGTGKSHRAVALAAELKVSAIIDDGLLIAGNRILAGRSAKAEHTLMAAIRRAIFFDPEHAADLREAIVRLQPSKLLVLGTSLGMILRICSALELPEPVQYLSISQLASPEEVALAQQQRVVQGTHVIPVSPAEVRRLIPVALADVIDHMRRTTRYERTQVRPPFGVSAAGLQLQLSMVRPLIDRALEESGSGLYRLNHASMYSKQGLVLYLDLAVAPIGLDATKLIFFQSRVKDKVLQATGSALKQVELSISRLLN